MNQPSLLLCATSTLANHGIWSWINEILVGYNDPPAVVRYIAATIWDPVV